MREYSLKEIARELNVSRGTLDRVIHNRGGISAETTARVQEFLDRINYRPNRIGQSLARRKLVRLYVSFHDTQAEFFKDIRTGINAAAAEIADFGFNVEFEEVSRDSAAQLNLVREAMRGGADALALSAYEPDHFVELVDEIARSGKPVVTFNNDVVSSRRMAHVGSNYRAGGRLAGEVLAKAVKSGAVAVLRRSSSYFQNRERVTGFTEVIDSYEAIRMAGCFGGSTDYDSAYQNMARLLETIPDLHGLFMLNNETDIITATCDAIRDSSRTPFDVVTLDLPAAVAREITRGRISATVCQDPFSQGYYAVKILFKILHENVVPSRSIYSTRLDVLYRENLDNYGKELYQTFL